MKRKLLLSTLLIGLVIGACEENDKPEKNKTAKNGSIALKNNQSTHKKKKTNQDFTTHKIPKTKTLKYKTKPVEKSVKPIVKPTETVNPSDEKRQETSSENSSNDKITAFVKEEVVVKDSVPAKIAPPKKKAKEIVSKPIKVDSVPPVKLGSFGIFGYGSPTLSYTLGKNAPLDSRLNNNPKSTGATFSYGAYLCYTGGGRFSSRIGFAKTNLNFKTENVPVNVPNYENIAYTDGFSNAVIYNESSQSETMTLIQDISYSEIPLELKYRMLDRKIGINAIGGFSYLFMSGNKVTAVTSNGNEYKIGRTKNMMASSFGLNFGLGLDYKISKKVRFNLEPMVKYNLKGYHSHERTNFFSINVLTGLQLEL